MVCREISSDTHGKCVITADEAQDVFRKARRERKAQPHQQQVQAAAERAASNGWVTSSTDGTSLLEKFFYNLNFCFARGARIFEFTFSDFINWIFKFKNY